MAAQRPFDVSFIGLRRSFAAGAQTLAPGDRPRRGAIVGGSPSFIDEHQVLRIEVELVLEPGFVAASGCRTVLLGRVRRVFSA